MRALRAFAREILTNYEGFEKGLKNFSPQQRAIIDGERSLLDVVVQAAKAIANAPDHPLTENQERDLEGRLERMRDRVSTITSLHSAINVDTILKYMRFHDNEDEVAQFLEAFQPMVAQSVALEAAATHRDQIAAETKLLSEARDKANLVVEQLIEKLSKASELVEDIKGIAAAKAVSVHAKAYKNASLVHNVVSFLALLGILLPGTLIARKFSSHIGSVMVDVDVVTWPELAKALYPNVPYMVLFVFGLVLLIKIAVSERHNAIVAAQKRTALETFETFVDVAADETRETILLTTTAFIFTAQGTGYSKSPVEISRFKAFGASIEGS